jgi:hypothetical protein
MQQQIKAEVDDPRQAAGDDEPPHLRREAQVWARRRSFHGVEV